MLRLDCLIRRGAFVVHADACIDAPSVGLFGPSGAGKTTLLLAIAGLLRPDQGRIEINGEPVFDSAANLWVPPHRRRLGVVFQDDRLLPHRTVDGNLRFARRFAKPGGGPSLDEIAELLEINAIRELRPASLSGGERRRVALARALACRPRMLLLDEPTTGLDRARRREMMLLLQRIRDASGVPIVLVSHELEETLQLAKYLALVHDGRIAGAGDIATLAEHDLSLRTLTGAGLSSVLRMRVRTSDAHSIVVASSPTGGFALQALPGAWREGEVVSVGVRAEDVALARSRVEGVSIQNQFPATVRSLHACDGRHIVRLDAGVPLLAIVSEAARRRLDLREGLATHCLVKASAVRILGLRAAPE